MNSVPYSMICAYTLLQEQPCARPAAALLPHRPSSTWCCASCSLPSGHRRGSPGHLRYAGESLGPREQNLLGRAAAVPVQVHHSAPAASRCCCRPWPIIPLPCSASAPRRVRREQEHGEVDVASFGKWYGEGRGHRRAPTTVAQAPAPGRRSAPNGFELSVRPSFMALIVITPARLLASAKTITNGHLGVSCSSARGGAMMLGLHGVPC